MDGLLGVAGMIIVMKWIIPEKSLGLAQDYTGLINTNHQNSHIIVIT